MRKRFCMISLTAVMAFGLTACGNAIPDMTDAQMQAIGEYAAATLMKYDVNHRSRLVDLELVAQAEEQRRAQAEAEALRREQEAAAAQEEAGMRPTEDTPVIGTDGMLESAPISMEEVLDLPEGVTITYREVMACDSYPEGDESFFSLSATQGNRFLVLKFDLYNGSGQEQTIDILSQGAVFRVTANGEVKRNALTTMLLDDLTSYQNTLAAGTGAEAVLVMEVQSSVADSLSSLSLELKNGSKTYTGQFL